MHVKTNKTFKMPKASKILLSSFRGTSAQRNEFKSLLIQSLVAETDFKNRRFKTKKSE